MLTICFAKVQQIIDKTKLLFTYNQTFHIFMGMKESKHISIALDPDILKQLEDSNYNKSKLIDKLLSEHFKNKNRQKANFLEK